jgi:hypothetical protein
MQTSRILNELTETVTISPDAGTMSSGIAHTASGAPRRRSTTEERQMFDNQILRKPRNGAAGREIPFSFSQQTYPLNPSATVSFTLEEQQEITLIIYDSYGRVIHTLYDRAVINAGYHELKLYGDAFPAGGCYARLETRFGIQQRTLILTTSKV